MSYGIEWSGPALRELRKLDRQVARRVVRAVTGLALDPHPPGVRALIGEPYGTLRLRVGDYRVVYRIDDGQVQVLVVRVAHRVEVYRRR